MPDGCDDTVQEIVVSAGEELGGAIVTETESDGLYPNHACQNWNIIADESQVQILYSKPRTCCSPM